MPSSLHRLPAAILCASLALIGIAHAHQGTVASLKIVNHQLIASPHNSRLHIRRATLLLENDQPAPALESITRAHQLGADSAALSLLEAKTLLALEKPAEALAILSNCPPSIPVLTQRVRALHALGKTAAAIKHCRTLLATDPDPDIAFLAAEILAETNNKAAAVKLLDTTFPENSRPSSIELLALEYEISMKSWPSALARTTPHILSSPRPEPWIARRAEILTMAGRHNDAAKTWQELLTTIRNLPPSTRASHAMLLLARKARAATDSPPLSCR